MRASARDVIPPPTQTTIIVQFPAGYWEKLADAKGLRTGLAHQSRAVIDTRHATSRSKSERGDHGYCQAGVRPHLEARSHRPQPARHRLLQALDAADDLGPLPRRAGDVLVV